MRTYDAETNFDYLPTPCKKGRSENLRTSTATTAEHIQQEADKDVEKTKKRSGFAKTYLKGDLLKPSDLEVENREIIDAYDAWQNGGEKEWEKYCVTLYDALKNLIKNHIGMHHFAFGSVEFEDLMAEAKVAILEKIQTYDPRQSKPASYFGPKIDEMLKKCNHQESHMTEHYISMRKKLNDAAQALGYDDCMNPELDPVTLSVIAEIPLSTVVATLEQVRITHDSMDVKETMEKVNKTVFTSSPDVLFEKQEDAILIGEAFRSLTPYEQFIFAKMEIETERDSKGNERHWSARKVAKYLSEPEVYKSFGLKKAPDNNEVCSDLEIIKQKLRHFPGMKKRFGYEIMRSRATSYTEYRQAADEEIEAAIEAGVIIAL